MTIEDRLNDLFKARVRERCEKGITTYGVPLDAANDKDYDWKEMIIEELLDALQYQQKEIKRLETYIHRTGYIRQDL
jgi:hypothetical protein